MADYKTRFKTQQYSGDSLNRQRKIGKKISKSTGTNNSSIRLVKVNDAETIRAVKRMLERSRHPNLNSSDLQERHRSLRHSLDRGIPIKSISDDKGGIPIIIETGFTSRIIYHKKIYLINELGDVYEVVKK